VNEVLLLFLDWASTHYRHPDGNPTTEIAELKRSLRPVRELYGHDPATEFGPKKLAAVRQAMVEADWCRTLIDRRVERVKRAFRWATAEELVPVTVYEALRTLSGLQKGRTAARESDPVTPVDPAHVVATLPFVRPPVRAMIRLQQLTGMRPQDVCRLRLGEIDRTGDVWLYRPERHKTAHRGKVRVVPIGPRARAVIEDFLAGATLAPDVPVFSPARDREERFREMRAARKCKVYPSQPGGRQKAKPRRVPSAEYHPHAYTTAIGVACEKGGIPHWHPNQLRHLFGTDVRRGYGIEAAQVLLGHTRADVTQVYAERNLGLAVKVAAEIG
jgi:integrase